MPRGKNGGVEMTMSQRDEQKLSRLFRELVAISDKPVADLLRQQGRLIAVAAAMWTKNIGKDKQTGIKHEENIERKIRRVYSPPEIWVKVVSKRAGYQKGEEFKKAMRNGSTRKAQNIIDNIGLNIYKGKRVECIKWDKGAAHRRSLGKKPERVFYVVTTWGKVKSYIKHERKKAGDVKSGWARAAEMFGGSMRDIPNWVKGKARKHTTKGKGSVTGTDSKKMLSIINYNEYDPAFTRLSMVFAQRAEAMKKNIKKLVEAEQRRLKRKYK
jgi:hypothetical protein